jgi:glycosyltransferase involved in cell wall biosynthesis
LYFSPGYNCPIGNPCRFIFCLHDLNHLHVPENSSRLKRLYYASVIRPAVRNSEAVITVSQFSRDAICEWARVNECKIINVGNGVSDHFEPNGPVKTFGPRQYFLHVGSDRPHKNLRRIIEAFFNSGLSRDFDFVTTAIPTMELASLVNSNSRAGCVRFLGPVAEEELPALYRGAHGLICASIYEGFGLPIVEAMACGTPVITSSVTSMPEVAGNAAIIVDPYDVEALADGMLKLASDAELRHSLRSRGIERAKMYSWQLTALRVQNILATSG